MELLWQESDNSVWKTNIKPVCSICGRECSKALEVVFEDGSDPIRCCFEMGVSDCFRTGILMQFAKRDDDYVLMRLIEHKGPQKKNRKREPIGLSKRYQVLKRDGFQCVICGASGKDARLEIDHKIPISEGGSDGMDNLQTLCFNCNRGKRDN